MLFRENINDLFSIVVRNEQIGLEEMLVVERTFLIRSMY